MPSNTLLRVLSFSLLPAVSILAGGCFALWRAPNSTWRSTILHFAAGVVFSVVAVELLPDIVKAHKPIEVVIGFGGGVAAMLGLRALMGRMPEQPEFTASPAAPLAVAPGSGLPLGLLFGIAVDFVVDGLLLGVGFAAGQKEGVLLTLALTTEVLALGLATSTQMRRNNMPVKRCLLVLATLSLSFVLGAAGGATLLTGLSGEMLELVLSFGLAALLFLVTEELLVEAHESVETPLLTASFFGGFLLFLLLGMSG